MADRTEDVAQRRAADAQEAERIMRSADALGHDPGRVARALRHAPAEPAELQRTLDVKRRPALARFFDRAFTRRS